MKTLTLFALLLSVPAFASLRPAKDLVATNAEKAPTIFDLSRPALERFYLSVNTERGGVKDEIKTTSSSPKAQAEKSSDTKAN